MSSYFPSEIGSKKSGDKVSIDDFETQQNSSIEMIATANMDTNGKAVVLGDKEDAFKIKKIIDIYDQTNRNQSADENLRWLSIYERFLKQTIKITKTEINSITVKLRNLTNITVPITFEIKNQNNERIGSNIFDLNANTEMVTHEILFNIKYVPEGEYYFIINPVNVAYIDLSINGDEGDEIDWSTDPIAIMYDFEGNYNKSLVSSDNGEFYEPIVISTSQNTEEYPIPDLWFEEKFATNNVYSIEPGEAQILGEYVVGLDTHISIHGRSEYGNRTDLIGLGVDGHYKVIDGDVWVDKEIIPKPFNDNLLNIAYITTYKDLNKPPLIVQDDENIDTDKVTRPRQITEEIRRLKKKQKHNEEYNALGRIKYNLLADELRDISEGDGTKLSKSINNLGQDILSIDSNNKIRSKYWSFKEFEKNETPIPGMYVGSNGINEFVNINHTEDGLISLSKEEDIDLEFTTKLEEKDMYPQYRDRKYTKRVFTIYRKSGDWISTYPAINLDLKKETNIKNLIFDVREFKGLENVQISIFKRDENNWLKKDSNDHLFESEPFDLTRTKVNEASIQVLDNKLVFSVNENFKAGEYTIIMYGTPYGFNGKIYIKSYNGPEIKGYLSRYQGPFPTNKFLNRNIYNEIFELTSSQTTVKYYKEGYLLSETIQASENNKIAGASFKGNIIVPNGCSYLVEGSVDGGRTWLPFKDNKVTFTNMGKQFKWKITLFGNGEKTPQIIYDNEEEYSLKFNISEINDTQNITELETITDRGYVLNTTTMDSKEIIKQVAIDNNYTQIDNIFNIFEYIRFWGNENDGKIIVDVESSGYKIGNNRSWNTILVDLDTDDFENKSTDYSNYDIDVESDEHNYKFDYSNEFYNDETGQLITTGISGWGDINKNGITGVEYDYNESDPLFGDRTSIVNFTENFSDKEKIFIGKRFKKGINLSKFQQIMVSITPKLDQDKIGFRKEDLIPGGVIKFIISLGENGETGTISEGKEYYIYYDLVRGEPNNILIDISQDLYAFTDIKSIGFKLNDNPNFHYTFIENDSFQVNYITGEAQNKAQLIPSGGKWTSLATTCTCSASNDKTVFTLNGNLGANKLAKIDVSRYLDIWQLVHMRLSINQTITKGKLYFDFCSDLDGDHVIMSMPIPLISGASVGLNNYINIIKKIKDNQSTLRSIHLRSNLGSVSNLVINLGNLWTYIYSDIPMYNDAIRMKIYSLVGNNLLKPPEIRKIGCIFRLG